MLPDKNQLTSQENANIHPLAAGFQLDLWTWLLLAMLAAAIAVTYGRLARAGFVDLDDSLYVFDNPHVLGGITPRNVAWACNTREGGIVMPLTWWSLQFDATLSSILLPVPPLPGQAALPDAAIYHVDNIILHVLSAWMLFLFLYKITASRWPCFIVALLWAVHPLRVESVAWVTERKDMLSGLFGFLAMYLYVVWQQRRRPGEASWGGYIAVCIAMGLSLMAKPTFVSLPLVLMLLDYWPLGRLKTWRDLWPRAREKWALFLIAFCASIIATMAARRIHLPPVSHAALAANAILSYVRYLVMHVDFRSLAVFYPFAALDAGMVGAAAVIIIAVTALCLWQRKQRPWLIIGWFWYLIALLPMIGFVQRGLQAYGDRFTYFPAVGLLFMLVFSIPHSCYENPRKLPWILLLAASVALTLMAFSFHQAGFWRDSVTLFEHTRDVTPSNNVVKRSLGMAYQRAGRVGEAMLSFQSVTDLLPDEPPIELSISNLYIQMDRPDLAIPYGAKAVELQPRSPMTHDSYGAALLAAGRFDEAAHEFEQSLELSPADDFARQSLERARTHR